MKKNKKRNKIHKRAFTLMELLVSLLIMSLVVASSVTGMVSISSSFRRILRGSNAMELSTMLSTAISGELKYAKFVEVDENNNLISFYSPIFRTCKFDYQLSTDPGKLYVYSNASSTNYLLLIDTTYPDGLIITDLSIKYDDISKSFEVKLKIGDAKNDDIANTKFVVKALNA